jgi:hypothetical protein
MDWIWIILIVVIIFVLFIILVVWLCSGKKKRTRKDLERRVKRFMNAEDKYFGSEERNSNRMRSVRSDQTRPAQSNNFGDERNTRRYHPQQSKEMDNYTDGHSFPRMAKENFSHKRRQQEYSDRSQNSIYRGRAVPYTPEEYDAMSRSQTDYFVRKFEEDRKDERIYRKKLSTKSPIDKDSVFKFSGKTGNTQSVHPKVKDRHPKKQTIFNPSRPVQFPSRRSSPKTVPAGSRDITPIQSRNITPVREQSPFYIPEKINSPFTVINDEREFAWSRKLSEMFHGRGRGENISRAALEEIYGVKFPNIRPDWLVNPETGRKLEIDCFGLTKRGPIAVEYNGIQHYHFSKDDVFFHKTEQDFINQLRRDQFKKEVIEGSGIPFIIIPYTIKYHEIGIYLLDKLRELNLL